MQKEPVEKKDGTAANEEDYWGAKTKDTSKIWIGVLCVIGLVVYAMVKKAPDTGTTKGPNISTAQHSSQKKDTMSLRYRNPKSGDRGEYFVVSQSTNGVLYRAVSKRVGPSDTWYTRVEINCRNKSYRVLGEGSSIASINDAASPNMTRVIPGSSKSDLVNFICP